MKDPALRAHVPRFIALTDQGVGETAFSRSFDLAPEDLQAKAKERLRGVENAKRVLSLKPEFERLAELPRPTAMARDRILFELAYLLAVSLPTNAPVAEQFVTEALQVNPSNARAQALAGRLREQAGDHDAATKACERALGIAGDDSEVMLLCAEGVVRRLADHQEVPLPDVLHARALFEKATRLDPDSPRPWAGLGATYVTTADDPTRGIQALRRALALDPTSEHAPFLLAELLARNPDGMEEARELGEASLKRSKAPNVRLGLQELLTEMDEIDDEDSVLSGIKAAQQQVNEDNLSEALRILDGILPKIGDPDLLAETRRWRAEVEQRLREKP
jgi:tetratricopeptide (TPR) repeat protein